MKSIINICFLFLISPVVLKGQENILISGTWKVKSVRMEFNQQVHAIYDMNAASNEADYSGAVYTFTEDGVYTIAGNGITNSGTWSLKGTDSIMLDEDVFKLAQLSADSFVTRSTSLHIVSDEHVPDTSYLFFSLVPAGALPVQLVDFTGKWMGNKVELNWQTASEDNNRVFEIEHAGGSGSFRKIGEVPGKGNSSTLSFYSFPTEHFVPGKNQYRLKQIDLDGKSTYSDIVVLEAPSAQAAMIVFPNPAEGQLTLQVSDANGHRFQLRLTDMAGRISFYRAISIANGAATIMLPDNLKGWYIVTAVDEQTGRSHHQKILIK